MVGFGGAQTILKPVIQQQLFHGFAHLPQCIDNGFNWIIQSQNTGWFTESQSCQRPQTQLEPDLHGPNGTRFIASIFSYVSYIYAYHTLGHKLNHNGSKIRMSFFCSSINSSV